MTAVPRAKTPRGGELGNYERHVATHVIPSPESEGGHWAYRGQALRLDEVRRFLVSVLDRDATIDTDTRFKATCGRRSCVRPPHLEETSE